MKSCLDKSISCLSSKIENSVNDPERKKLLERVDKVLKKANTSPDVLTQCFACEYWGMYPDGLNGYCRRHAPTTIWGEVNYVSGLYSDLFPATDWNDSCGEGKEISAEDYDARQKRIEEFNTADPGKRDANLEEQSRCKNIRIERLKREGRYAEADPTREAKLRALARYVSR